MSAMGEPRKFDPWDRLVCSRNGHRYEDGACVHCGAQEVGPWVTAKRVEAVLTVYEGAKGGPEEGRLVYEVTVDGALFKDGDFPKYGDWPERLLGKVEGLGALFGAREEQ